jgi:DNA-binding NarL/FixJ family response regulator
MDTVRILIADDHRIFRDGLRKLLEAEPDFEVVGEACDGRDVVTEVRDLDPDVLLLDMSMPGLGGLEALQQVSQLKAHTRTLLLTAAIEKEELLASLQFGARGLVMKESATPLLLKGIRSVMRGEYWVGHESVGTLIDALRLLTGSRQSQPKQQYGLSDRELQIIAAVVATCGNKRIAELLSISEKTVKHHLTNIYDKLGVSNRLELAMFALDRRLDLPELGPEI